MKAAFIEHTGPPECIRFGELPTPSLGQGQVLVRVGAVSVNPIDTYLRAGTVAMNLPMPYILGCDLAGTVEEVGPGSTRLAVGQRVWGSNQGLLGRQGTFAEFAVVDETWLYPTPDGIEDEQAAAVALVGITAHLGLFSRARLAPGESVFVHGGSGGVGACVIQMAKAVGARVATTAGSDEKAQTCRQLGADLAVNYRRDDVDAAIREFAPEGINVWSETLRAPDFDRIVGRLAPRGRVVLMAGRDARPVFPVGPFYVKDASLLGMAMFNAPPEAQRKCAEDINRWLAEGRLRANIARRMPLAETTAAHRLQEENTLHGAGTLAGKIVLAP
ncbi:MAG: NADPH:quinone reductase [Pirellulales bacterium]|nr:NADPH:quinone reductase [Pirellulales bacterium]